MTFLTLLPILVIMNVFFITPYFVHWDVPVLFCCPLINMINYLQKLANAFLSGIIFHINNIGVMTSLQSIFALLVMWSSLKMFLTTSLLTSKISSFSIYLTILSFYLFLFTHQNYPLLRHYNLILSSSHTIIFPFIYGCNEMYYYSILVCFIFSTIISISFPSQSATWFSPSCYVLCIC